MLSYWRVVRSSPGAYSQPDELSSLWESGLELEAPAPVATIADADDLDDFDWWHRATVEADVPICIEFEGLTFPATVFVDGSPVAACESMFLPVRVDLERGRHEVCVCFHSLNTSSSNTAKSAATSAVAPHCRRVANAHE